MLAAAAMVRDAAGPVGLEPVLTGAYLSHLSLACVGEGLLHCSGVPEGKGISGSLPAVTITGTPVLLGPGEARCHAYEMTLPAGPTPLLQAFVATW